MRLGESHAAHAGSRGGGTVDALGATEPFNYNRLKSSGQRCSRIVHTQFVGFVKNAPNRYSTIVMPPTLSPDELEALLAYARDKFEDERYPLAPALRPVR